MFKKIILLLCSFLSLQLWAQQIIPCGSDEVYVQHLKQNPELKLIEQNANQDIRNSLNILTKKGNGIIYIPVVFHVMHNNGLENIPQWQMMDQIRILNEDFRRKPNTNGFNSEAVSADVQIEFRLAQFDPNGNKSDGINRIQTTLTNSADDKIKALSFWDSNKYLNIWVVKTIDLGSGIPAGNVVLGYAQFPWERQFRPNTDGVVVISNQIGVIGTGQINQGGRTLTHEIGHWLGLFHTFQDGCVGGLASNCNSEGDEVCDTPPVALASSGCQTNKNSCTNDVPDLLDQVRNYMDYSDGSCMNIYTAGQKNRIYSVLTSFRNGIYGNGVNNVAYAGINTADGTFLPVADASIKAPYAMDFEGNSFATDGWKLNNFNNPNNGFRANNSTSYSGTSSIFMQNFNNGASVLNGRDGFQSPQIDLRSMPNPFVEFRYAYVQKTSNLLDSLILFITPNFGMTETRLFAQRGANLATAPILATEFTPTSTADWRKISIRLNNVGQYNNARFRFEFVNRRGNNIFIDNFTLTNGSTAIGEEAKRTIGFEVYPNPITKQTAIEFELKEPSNVTIELKDITGRSIYMIHQGTLQMGKHTIPSPNNNLSGGIYLIDFKSDAYNFNHKVLVN